MDEAGLQTCQTVRKVAKLRHVLLGVTKVDMMFNKKIMAAALSVLALMPMGAVASTVVGNIADGGSYNMISGAFNYSETFVDSEGAGVRTFTFENHNSSSVNMLITAATINEVAGKFTGGVTFKWLLSGVQVVFASMAGVSQSTVAHALDNLIAAGGTDTLQVSFGDPSRITACPKKGVCNPATPNFTVQMSASPVPLPAGGLLLAGAMAGLAALRRRKSV